MYHGRQVPWDSPTAELVELWDMLEFYAETFVVAVGKVNARLMRANTLIECGSGERPYGESEARRSLKTLSRAAAECEKVDLGAPVTMLNKAKRLLEKRGAYTPADFRAQCGNILESIEYDLRERRFAYVPRERVALLKELDLVWPSILKAFPSSRYHATEALYCYALDRHTACVFHSMVVLEPGLRALAKRLKARTRDKSWGQIIDKIEAAIEGERKRLATQKVRPRAARLRQARLTFHAEAAKEFTYFKDAWRNHTAHGRARYDEGQARSIMGHVRDFMMHLSTQLREIG